MIGNAHRVSTIRKGDEMLWLKKGEFVELGKHADLVALKGYFYELEQKQQLDVNA